MCLEDNIHPVVKVTLKSSRNFCLPYLPYCLANCDSPVPLKCDKQKIVVVIKWIKYM